VIRRATSADVQSLVQLGAMMHAESPRHSRLAYSPRKVAAMIQHMLVRPMGAIVLVAESAGGLEGAAVAYIDSEWYSEDAIAQEIVLYVVPERRGGLTAARLIAQMDAWARSMGARWLQAGSTTGIAMDRTIDLYEHLGFSRAAVGVERSYH
jgi:GNAT superfamily N-acetyltransferase